MKLNPTHLPIAVALAAISLTLTACSGDNTVTYGGQTYKTVKIGEQVWLAENLNYEAEGSVCYGNNPDNCAKYGRLYNWETAMKVCPKGWHLPSDAEWDKLLRFVDGDTGSESPYNSGTAGKYLKAVIGWNYSDYYNCCNGTDDYGFSALPGSDREPGGGSEYSEESDDSSTEDDDGPGCGGHGSFGIVGDRGYWWSAHESGLNSAHSRYINYDTDFALWSSYDKSFLFSVRCIKD